MRAIIWKELRENTKWAALMLIGMLIVMTAMLMEEFGRDIQEDVFLGELFVAMALGSCAAALILGFHQTALETRRDQWAFLMHRGLSGTKIFLGKTITGLGLYLVTTLSPVLLAVAWCSWRGIERYPFHWRMVVPSLAVAVAAFGFYFAAMLVSVRRARWYSSRLLPLVTPGLTVLLVVAVADEFSEPMPLTFVLAVLCCVVVMGIAAWGVFVGSGESTCVPALSRVCLGAMLTVAFLAGFGSIYAGATWFIHDVLRQRSVRYGPYSEYCVNSEGHVVLFEHGEAPWGKWYDRRLLRVTDLDEPSSKKYDALVDQRLFKQLHDRKVEIAAEWDGLPMAHCWYGSEGSWLQSGRRRLLQNCGTAGELVWFFSRPDRVIYGYQKGEWDYARRRWNPPQLQWIAGPDGFISPSEFPSRRFRRLLAVPRTSWGWSGRAWPTEASRLGGRRTWRRHFFLFDDVLLEIDPLKQSLRQHYAAPDGKRIRSLAPIGEDRFAVVFEDSIHIHERDTVVAGEREDYEDHGKVTEFTIALPGKHLYSIPIPEQARRFDGFAFGELTNQDVVVFQCYRSYIRRLVHMQTDGTVVRNQGFANVEGGPRGHAAAWCGLGACVPLAIGAALGIAEAISQTLNGTGPGFVIHSLIHNPLPVSLVFAVMLLLSQLSGWIARRTARRYGFTRRETVCWVCVAVLFGPAGLLSLLCLRDWPARQPCEECGKLRPVDRDVCVNCGNVLQPPATDGTEILDADLSC